MPPELEQTETIRREISGAQLPSLSLDGLGLLLAVDLLPSPTYLPGPNCLVLETGYVFLLHLSYTHRHFPNKLLCLHLLTGCFPNKNPCRHLLIEAD